MNGAPSTAGVCASCGGAVDLLFCPRCGERRLDDHDLSLRHFVSHSLHDVTHFDTKIFRSVGVLLGLPGQLTVEYFAGRRVALLSPVQLFVMINVIFFFTAPKLGLFRFGYDYFVRNDTVLWKIPTKASLDAVRGARSEEELRTDFDREIDHPKRLLIFVMVALFAALAAVLLAHRRRFFVEHVVFALHYYAFWMLMTTAIPLLLYAVGWIVVRLFGLGARFAFGDTILVPTIIVLSIVYLYVALRRFYGSAPIAAGAQATILSFAMMWIFLIYRGALFLLALRLV